MEPSTCEKFYVLRSTRQHTFIFNAPAAPAVQALKQERRMCILADTYKQVLRAVNYTSPFPCPQPRVSGQLIN